MRCPADAALVARDRRIPGLAAVLDPDVILSAAVQAAPATRIRAVTPTYVRYKPATSCLVAYRLHTGDGDIDAYAKAHRAHDKAKANKLLRSADDVPPWWAEGLPVGEQAVLVFFPHDRRLRGLRALLDPRRRARVLRRAGYDRTDRASAPRRLRYKPERRYVARIDAADSDPVVVKCYADDDFDRADGNSRAFRSTGPLVVARRLGASSQHRTIAFEWVDGTPLLPQAHAPYGGGLMEATGEALARLHAQPAPGLARLDRQAEARSVLAAARSMGAVLPEIAEHAGVLASRCAAELVALPEQRAAVHGDFSTDQLLCVGDRVAILDYDAAAIGDPADDLGRFRAHLIAGATAARGGPAAAEAAAQALVRGYLLVAGSDPRPRLDVYTAAGLLRLAAEPFRYRTADWPGATRRILEEAERVWQP